MSIALIPSQGGVARQCERIGMRNDSVFPASGSGCDNSVALSKNCFYRCLLMPVQPLNAFRAFHHCPHHCVRDADVLGERMEIDTAFAVLTVERQEYARFDFHISQDMFLVARISQSSDRASRRVCGAVDYIASGLYGVKLKLLDW